MDSSKDRGLISQFCVGKEMESACPRRGPKMAVANHLLVIGRVTTRLLFLWGRFSFALLNH